MEQANKPSAASIFIAGLLSAVAFGVGHYCRYGMATSSLAQAFGEFLAVLGWLLAVWTVLLMLLWARAKS
jgi:hypothetical protein